MSEEWVEILRKKPWYEWVGEFPVLATTLMAMGLKGWIILGIIIFIPVLLISILIFVFWKLVFSVVQALISYFLSSFFVTGIREEVKERYPWIYFIPMVVPLFAFFITFYL